MTKKTVLLFLASVLLAGTALAEDAGTSPLTYSITTDFAWYPESAYTAGADHFAPVTGAYSALQARTTLSAAYRVPAVLPFVPAQHPLFRDSNVTFTGELEVTPVTVMPKFSVSFSPAAFLVFSAGGTAGTGWDVIGIQGMAEYDPEAQAYENLDPFRSWYLNGYANGTFMFDTAALWPGDWHHIIMVASYEVSYKTLTGTARTVWDWQTIKNCADGWQYDQYYLLGYQMPGTVSLAGVSAELYGHYNASDYGEIAASFSGDFMTVEICPLVQLTLSERDTLIVLGDIKSRRSFTERHDSEDSEPVLTYAGREWFFQDIALRWKHTF